MTNYLKFFLICFLILLIALDMLSSSFLLHCATPIPSKSEGFFKFSVISIANVPLLPNAP